MARVRASVVIEATPEQVWAAIEDIATHVEWMHDAAAIHFTTPQTKGVGTQFDCETRIGPLRTTDRMEITRWEPGVAMGVRHVGVVTGSGAFELRDAAPADGDRARTEMVWDETLTFPWWMGGPVGGVVGGRILGLVWRRNLAALKRRVEAGLAP